MKSHLHTGEWFLPGSDLLLPGGLRFEESTKLILLELYSDKYLDASPVIKVDPDRDKRYNSKNYNDDYAYKHGIIFGKGFETVTLYDAHWNGTNELGGELYELTYRIGFVFFGAHFSQFSEACISTATFQFPYIGSWFDAETSLFPLKRDKEDQVSNHPLAVPHRANALVPAHDNLELRFFDNIEKQSKEYGIHEERRFHKLIEFSYKQPVSFETILTDASCFENLMEFCIGEPISKRIHQISVAKEFVLENSIRHHYHYQEQVVLPVWNHNLHNGKNIDSQGKHSHFMLVSRWSLQADELDNLIWKWFNNKEFYPIYDFYIDSNNWLQKSDAMLSNVMFNNRFLNLIQGLEGFYKRMHVSAVNDQDEFEQKKKEMLLLVKDPGVKKWLNDNLSYKRKKYKSLDQKLQLLIEERKEILHTLFGEKNDILDFFPRYAVTVRNNLSHGIHTKTSHGSELHVFFKTGQLLLAICILGSLGIENIADRIGKFYPFRDLIFDIRRSKLNFV